jgi:hypothetical protein
MPMQTWMETIAAGTTDSVAVANTVTETTIAPVNAKIVLPSNYFDRSGASLRLLAGGRISTVVTSPGTLTFKVKLGATAAATFTTGTLNTTAQTNAVWWLEWYLTARTNGSATSFMHIAQLMSAALANAATNPPIPTAVYPTTAPAVGATFDGTVANTLDVTAQWSVANAANSIQTHMLMVQSLN